MRQNVGTTLKRATHVKTRQIKVTHECILSQLWRTLREFLQFRRVLPLFRRVFPPLFWNPNFMSMHWYICRHALVDLFLIFALNLGRKCQVARRRSSDLEFN